MEFLKKLLLGAFIVALVGLSTYLIVFAVLHGLKIKGNDSMFTAKEPYDLVLKHALVLDGTGERDTFRADIAIRDGQIVGVGYVNPKESPTFDAGGLTVIPAPLKIEKGEAVAHRLADAYPRYPAEEIYLQEGSYAGLNLAEAAYAAGSSPEELLETLKKENSKAKVQIITLKRKEELSSKELLARLTGYRAEFQDLAGRGIVAGGSRADLYIFETEKYPELELLNLFRKGAFPQPVFIVQAGEFVTL